MTGTGPAAAHRLRHRVSQRASATHPLAPAHSVLTDLRSSQPQPSQRHVQDVSAEAACETAHKALPRKRQGPPPVPVPGIVCPLETSLGSQTGPGGRCPARTPRRTGSGSDAPCQPGRCGDAQCCRSTHLVVGTSTGASRALSRPGPVGACPGLGSCSLTAGISARRTRSLARTGRSRARSASGPPAGFAATTTRGSRRGRRRCRSR